ncbi:hypothetical protein [Arenimonas metalli]|uniref:WxL domain-containing protein n=1 Tax=Arenimonas metalli CF5-1 TaxID=1384056 RepID=A0A091BB97_9GAMM|nr:hypothetical protein [Arenimonas metalli]KFN41715.1 hypothetical protein N787_05450 [Arenimonas metalli CF5-1]
MKNVRAIRGLALTSLASLGLIAVTPAFAESDFDIGTDPSVAARVDFEVVIPRFISFQVGTAGANVDLVQFDVADPNSGTAVARSNGGALDVAILGNVGNIEITTTTTLLQDAVSADTLDWAEIDTTSTDAVNLPAPVLGNGPIAAVTVTPTAGRIVNRSTTWSYEYANSALVGAGTYEGTVTYTASAP